ncbi:MAG: response regulator [Treponemataceae bacterium]|nr:MAG: response regulator [Treponemataceae bacterium]
MYSMKQVLMIDVHDLLRDFVKDKLVSGQVEVHETSGRRDLFTKLISEIFDLIIIDTAESITGLVDFLKDKQENLNARTIPVIVLGPDIPKEKVQLLAQLSVVKYFNKPIRFDVFFDSVEKILNTAFLFDTTPCVFEVRLDKNIIFVEIAHGLNRDKIALLRFKIAEIIESACLVNPVTIVTIADFEPSFVDGANLELLFDNLTAARHLSKKRIKVVSDCEFVRQFISGHTHYKGIEVLHDVSAALDFLAADEDADADAGGTAKVIHAPQNAVPAETRLTGAAEPHVQPEAAAKDYALKGIRAAVVDDEPESVQEIADALKKAKVIVNQYNNGQTFLDAAAFVTYDAVILDIMMPRANGLDVLKELARKKYKGIVLVYSKVIKREVVLQVMQLGAKGFMAKPQPPDVVLKKLDGILRASL